MRSSFFRHPSTFIKNLWVRNYGSFSRLTTARMSDAEKQRFIRLVEEDSKDPYVAANYEEVSERAGSFLKEVISPDTAEVLGSFRKKSRSLLLLENCPIVGKNGLPPTPKSSTQPKDKDWVSEYFMFAIAAELGAEPMIVTNTRDGKAINQVIPLQPESLTASSSKVALNFHTEVPHEIEPPDKFMLFCLRGNLNAHTNFGSLEDIIKFLPKPILEELQKPNFLMKSGDKSVFKEPKQLRCSILTIDENGEYELRFNTSPTRCEALTEDAQIAMNYLNDCIHNRIPIHSFTLSSGQFMLVPNTKWLHGRTAFDEEYKAKADDDLRWLQRMNLEKPKKIDPETLKKTDPVTIHYR